jgi:hypothetical protein
MADNIIKQTDNTDPRDQMALAGLVDLNPPKQTNQRIPDKSVSPFSQAPVAKQPTAPTNPVVQERIVGPSSRCALPTKPKSKLTEQRLPFYPQKPTFGCSAISVVKGQKAT